MEGWGGLRMGFQTMAMRRPLSRFMFRVAFLIWMTSTVLLSQNPSALHWTVVPSQLNSVIGLLDMNMNCNTVLGVSSFHRLPMFTHPDFWTFLTGDLVHHSFLFLLWGPVILLHLFSLQSFLWSEDRLHPQRGTDLFYLLT